MSNDLRRGRHHHDNHLRSAGNEFHTPPTTTTTLPEPDSTVDRIGTDDDFYRKTCEQNDIGVVAAESVDGMALEATAARMAGLLAARPDLAESVTALVDRVAVIGQDQRITDLPEFEGIYRIRPGTDWRPSC